MLLEPLRVPWAKGGDSLNSAMVHMHAKLRERKLPACNSLSLLPPSAGSTKLSNGCAADDTR